MSDEQEAEIVVNGKTVGYGIEGMLNALHEMAGELLDLDVLLVGEPRELD